MLTEDGGMLITLPDVSPMKPTPPAPRNKKPAKQSVKQAAAQRPKLVKTPTPLTSGIAARQPKPWKDVVLQPDPVFDKFLRTGCGVRSRKSWNTYIRNLTTVRKICGGAKVALLLQNVDAMVAKVDAAVQHTGLSLYTHASLLNSVLAVIRHALPCEVKARIQKQTEKLQQAHKVVHLKADQPAITNCATDRQRAGFVSYTELCKVRDALPANSREKLLLSFLTYIPPGRNDVACCRIYRSPPTDADPFKGNYILLGSGQKGSSYICYRHFKTRRAMGEVRVSLPAVLVGIIEQSLKAQPRAWLFPLAKEPNKPYTNGSFSRWANYALQKVCHNKFITVSLVRHAYSSHAQEIYDVTKCKDDKSKALCRQRLQAVARAMMHSTNQMLRYRFTMLDSGLPAPVDRSKVQRPAAPSNTPISVQLLPT